MDTKILQAGEETARIDLEQLTTSIWEEMQGQIDKAVIHQTLEKVLPTYEHARVLSFVPILMRRDVTEILHEMESR